MIREIEYRAWYYDKDYPEFSHMTFVCSIDFVKRKAKIGVLENIYKFDQIELMQYTGLKDKNGVKIFEGDIVKIADDEVCFIEWDEYDYWYRIKNKEVDDILAGFRPKDFEVIGNIYENKELLENE